MIDDPTSYRRLVGKLIYLTVTRSDVSFAVRLLSEFMHEPRVVHWQGAMRVLAYIKGAPGNGLLYKQHGHLDVVLLRFRICGRQRGLKINLWLLYLCWRQSCYLAQQEADHGLTI